MLSPTAIIPTSPHMKTGVKPKASKCTVRYMFWTLPFFSAVLLLAGVYLPASGPCAEPVTYRIGSVDERFGVSPSEVAQAAERAASVWEEASGMDLLRQDDQGAIAINLVYDYRQATADRLKGMSGKIENTRSSYESLKLWLGTQEEEFTQKRDTLRRDIDDYNARVRDLNARSEAASRGGPVSKDEFRRLKELKEELDEERRSLGERQEELNSDAEALNDLITLINQIAQSLNLEVVSYNRTGKPLQEEFREGCYEKKGARQTITVYYFSDLDRLVRLLAHEFGHALGLDHNDNPDALMYRINRGQGLALAPEDLASLRLICNGK